MGRYIYKPLTTDFGSDKERDEKKYQFIQDFKKSLTLGELILDLHEYDIYVANNGLEYPIPSTSEYKQEIIDWIESEEGPLASFKKDDLLNDKSEDSTESNLQRKKELIDHMVEMIKKFQDLCNEYIDENENDLLRLDRETKVWYDNLLKFINSKNGMIHNNIELITVIHQVIFKYIELSQRVESLNENIIKKNQSIDSTILTKYENRLQDLFKDLVNNSEAIDHKLSKSDLRNDLSNKDFTKDIPNYNFKLEIPITENITMENFPYFNNTITFNDEFFQRTTTIDNDKLIFEIKKKGEENT